ncbi:conserved hypothetical protein [Streptococcus agalactiae COH1]|nr:conserved hypothetical protein [Streptococcus agalactiae 515]EAO75772.1 conserved hypothetical protein [Streptococcus agalactiae COH1]
MKITLNLFCPLLHLIEMPSYPMLPLCLQKAPPSLIGQKKTPQKGVFLVSI